MERFIRVAHVDTRSSDGINAILAEMTSLATQDVVECVSAVLVAMGIRI